MRRPWLWWVRRWLVWNSMLQPRAHPAQMDLARSRYHTRTWKRKSRSVRAPTGQMSITLPEYGLSRARPGNIPISEWSPRWKMPSSPVPVISSQYRTQREQRMQRSASRITWGPTGTAFGLCTFSSTMRGSYRPCFM